MLMRILELTHPLVLYMQLGRCPLVNLMNSSKRVATNERTDIHSRLGRKETINAPENALRHGLTITEGSCAQSR